MKTYGRADGQLISIACYGSLANRSQHDSGLEQRSGDHHVNHTIAEPDLESDARVKGGC